MTTPPILFLIFNRPDTTARVFAAIRAARPARLYVAADGPRSDRPGEADRCAEARRIATAIDWPCELRTLFRDTNLGCRRAVSGAITWFFEHEPEGIILEDDCLPHPTFFPYCAELLARYRDDERVMCITGNNFQKSMGRWPYSYYFSIYNHCWGWASWRRAWEHYDAEVERFGAPATTARVRRLSRVRGFANYWCEKFRDVKEARIDSWAYVWTWSCWAQGGLTCTPRVNLVSNIGFGPDATHTKHAAEAELAHGALAFPLNHPPSVTPTRDFDDHVTRSHFRVQGPSVRARLRGLISSILRRAYRLAVGGA